MSTTMKWIALLGLAAGAAMFAGCPADEECASADDCADGEVCCSSGSCAATDADCGAGGTGGVGGIGGVGGVDPCDAGESLSETDGLCHPDCVDIADCYEFAAYCATDLVCYAIPGSGSCARVANAPPMDASGPLLFDGGQDTIGTGGALCAKEPATCTNNGNVCEFSFQVYDPDGDIAATGVALYDVLKFINDAGTAIALYDVPTIEGSTIRFKGCYAESSTTIAAAVQLEDLAGNHSNALCFEGSAP